MGNNPPVPQGQMLISGVEMHEADVGRIPGEPGQAYRVFVGPRWRHQYILVGPAEGENILRAFHSTYHLFGRVPDEAVRYETTQEELAAEGDRPFG